MKELTKKIICLLLIIIMMGGSLFTPIICFAEELRTEEKQEIKKLGSTPNLPNNEIKPVTKEEIVKKTKNDNYEINTLSIDFVSGAVKDGYGNLVWTPENSAYGHEFTFRVNYAISGLKELPANSVKITIPKSIIRNRDGKLDDSYLMSLPSDKEYDGTTNLAYTESGDYIVVYNPEEIEAGSNGYFEVSYSTNSETFYYRDYDSTKTDTIANGGTASDPFYATIQLKTDYDTLGQVSEEKNVFIDTHAKIVSTQKRYPTIYRSWDSSWMKDAPTDSDEYYYLVWEIRTNIENNPTQNYNFSLQDVVEDLTSGTTGEDYEFVGYKMAGEKYYSNKNTQKDIHGSSYRYDYVLTRHKISTYKDIEYTLKNTITANVDPIDQVDEDTNATSSNKFSWDPGFVVPTGHFDLFKYGNNNWVDKFGYFWDYANYELDKFQKDEIDELKGFKYYTETIGYAYPWTLKEGGSQDNPEDYGYNFVNYDTWDDALYLENETVPLSYNDYYLEFLTYSIENKGAQFDEFENKFKQVSPTYDDNETIIFYGKFNGGQEWIEIGKYNIKNKKVTLNEQYVKNMTTDKITFKDGVHCTGWRVTTSNKHYYTHIVVQPSFVLTNSEYVKEKVDNKDSIKLQNNVNTKITDYNDKTIFEKEISAIDYARVTYYDSHIDKKVSAVSNNVLGRKYIITWKVNAWEKVTSSNGKAEFLRQDSGKFYDLIPLGGDVDVKSIQVATEGGYLAENEYTYELIPNFKNSGRTMLIVSIDSQAQYYTVYYNTVHSWDSMKDYGRKVLNPVAYETGNEKITNGYPDNGGILSEGNKKLYSDLDEASNDNKFLYIEQTYNINAITAAVAGLYKKVKNSEESEYSYSTQVEPNEGYSYQLRYQNTYINKATDLILFDSIENFEVVDSEAGTTKTSGWKGTIESINLNQLVLKGIKPVVYVSTQDKLDLSSNNDITDSKVWTEMTDKTDLSQVKAIAIDMRKNLNGNDFILDPGDSITAVIHMKAPENTTKEIEENPYTYNNVYIKDKLIDELDGTEEYFIHQDYTQVKYHVVADVPVVKVNKNDESEKIKDITFRLYGTSNYGTKVDEYVTSTKDGIVYFKGIEAGNYILQEYEATNDWLEDHTEHNVEITNEKNVYVDGKLVSKIAPAKITNLPRIHTDVKIIKKNSINKWLIEGAKFKLSGTSNYGNEILMYATSKSDGTVLFENLEYGTYDLVEVEASEGYILNNNKYRVIVDENGNYDVLKVTENTEVRYAHTSNFNDDGTKINGTYKNDEYRKVTIDGAKKLHVYIRYGHVAGWVAIYNGDVVPTIENYDQSISGKLEGYSNTATLYYEREYDIPGDTAQIYFNYAGVLGGPYGYYAQITATNEETTSIYDRGNYIIYNEPLHSFRIVKKDSYTDTEIIGAKFKLTGVSDYGTSYNMEVESKLAGLAEFSGLEPGTYLLQETYVPELKDNEGNVISYMLEDTKYLVSIDSTGKIIIEGLEKNENGNFVFYNQRNKGQITITKKWIDNSNNDERPEPVIHISTEHPMNSKGISFRSNYDEQNGPLYYLDSNYKNKITGTFGRNTDKTEEEVKALGAVRLDENYDDLNSEYKIYGWIDDEGNCWWWSNAEVALLKDDSNYLFRSLRVKQLDTTDINTTKVTDMNHMFSDCFNLERLNISNLNTSKVTNMSHMFYSCFGLTELNLNNFDTSSVTNMDNLFSICTKLENLDISSFDTSKVTNMSHMFYFCLNLTELDVSKFDTSNVTNMSYMFYYCNKLTKLDVSRFNTRKVTDMSYMFYYGYELTKLDVSNFDTSNVTNMSHMFERCWNLTELDVSNFDTSKVTDMSHMFRECYDLKELELDSFNTSNVTNMLYMFYDCRGLTELDLENFNTSNVTNMSNMFSKCNKLVNLKLSNFNTRNVTNMSEMFSNCKSLTSLNLCKFNTKKVTNMSSMFYNCSLLTTIYVSDDFITNNVTSSSSMCIGDSKFTKGPMVYFRDNYNESNGPLYYVDSNYKNKITGTFARNTDKTESEVKELGAVRIDSDYNNANAEYKIYAWIDDDGNCYWWSNGNEAVMNNDSNRMFYDLANVNTLDLTGINTNSVTNMSEMFYNCCKITELNLNSFNTGNVTDMTKMFYNCKNLITIYASTNFDISNVISDTEMFGECSELKGKNGTSYDNSHIDKTYARMDKKDKPGYFTAAEYAYFRDNQDSNNGPLYFVDSDYKNKITGIFERNTDKTESEVKTLGAVRIDKDYNNADAEYKIYAWIDDGNCYWWSNADEACITDDSNKMFYYLSNVNEIDLSGINTSNLINMSSLFDNCGNVTEINLGNIDTSNVNNMNSLFYCCYKLAEIDLSCLNTEYVKNMGDMFNNCNSIEELDLSNFNTSSATNMEYMFYNCKELTTIYASDKFVTDNVTSVTAYRNMFTSCSNLKGGNGTEYNGYHVDKTYARMDKEGQPGYFTEKKFTEKPDVYFRNNYDEFNGPLYYVDSNYKNKITGTFTRNRQKSEKAVTALGAVRIDIDYDNENAEYKIYAWIDDDGNCYWWSNGNEAVMNNDSNRMFYDLANVNTLDLTGINTNSVTNMSEMFYNCCKITKLNLNSFNTSNVTDMTKMFYNCKNLITIYASTNFDTSNVNSDTEMFGECSKLKGKNGTIYNNSHIDKAYARIDKNNKPGYFTGSEVYFRDNKDSNNGPLYFVDSDYKNKITGTFERNTDKTESEVQELGALRIDKDYNNKNAKYKIYAWIDDGNCYWWSNADEACITDNSNRMFYYLSNVNEIDISGINTSNLTNMSSLFDSCSNLTTLNISELDTSNVTNMDSMFSCCSKLSNIDVSSFNTEKVKKMRCMFYNCNNLTDLNLNNFNTSIVTDMSYMFNNCKNLTSLNLSKFNTKKVTNMSSMFYNCSLLTTIYVSDDFITNNVTSSSSMFTGDSKLIGGNGTVFTTSYVTKTYARIDKEGQKGYFTKGPMVYFRDNYNESNGPLYYVDSNYKNKITGTFERDTDKTEKEVKALGAVRIDIDYNNENAEYKIYAWIDDDGNCYWWSNGNEAVMNNDSNRMFYDLANVNTLDLTGINTDSVTNMSNMFYGCSNITELDLNNLNTRNVTDMTRMFYNCKNLITIYASTNFDTSNVNSDTEMFGECSKLKGKNGTIYNNSHIDKTYARVDKKDKPGYFTAVEYAYFRDNYNSSTGPLYHVDSDYKNKITGTFERNTDKTEEEVKALGAVRIDKDYNNADAEYKIYAWISNGNCYWWSNADEACITDNSNRIFYYLTKVTKIDLTGMNTTNLINMSSLFDSCNSATEINLGNIDTSNVNNMNSLFSCCYKLTNIDLSCLNTEYVTNMRCMFYNCNVVKELDLSNYDTGSVTNMEYMFYNCKELTTIYASDKFVTTNVTVHGNMFGNCNKLKGGKGTIYNSGYIDKTYARIDIIANSGYFTKKVPKVSLNNFNKISELAYNDESVVIYEDNLNEKIKLFGSSTVEPSGKVTYSTSDINYDDAGNEIHWKKAGDTWTYTFYVDDPNATWYVWEQSMNGYNSNYTFTEPGIVEDKKATIINNKTEEKGKKYTAIETGNLKISKSSIVQIAKNNEGTGDIYTTLSRDEDNTEFTFKVVLSADENMKNLISGKKIFGDYVFNDGVCFIKLHSGESALIEGIPEGIKYSVTEEFMKEYSPSYTISNYNNYIIKKDSTCEVSVLNYKDVRFEDTVENTSFTLKKEVVGNYEIEEDYKFEIVLNNLIPNEEYYLSNGDTFVSDSTGSANVNVTLKNGETVTVQNIPVGSKYNVYEYEGDYISSYRITDTNNMGLINNTACSNTKTNTPLATNTETADEGENVTITFTNEKTVTQNLKLKKVVTDENDLDSYIFNIEFSNMKPESSFNSTVGKVLSDSNGKAELTVYLAGGEIAEFYNIPVGTNYKITELASGSIASYTIQDDNGTNKIVRSSGANTVSRQALSTENETVNQGEEVTVTFVNDVINQEVDSVTTSLDIVKDVIKPNGESFADCDETFMFEIKTDNENNPMPDETTISIKGNGIVGFGEITFTDTGTYTYEVKEKAGDLDCYNYDDTIYTIIYEVTNTDGLLEITKYVKKNGFDSDIIKFTNKVIKFDTIINKIDEDGNYLNGAKLQIIDSSEKVVKEWVTDEGSYNTKLLPGKYILHEVSAPNGYDLSEDVIFNVSEDGIITDSNGEVIEKVIMEDKKAKEIVEPEEEEDNEPEPEPEEKGDEKTIPEEKGDDKPTPQEKNDDKKSEEKNENNNNTNPEDNKTEEKNNSENNIEKENEQVSSVQTGDNLHVYLRILIIAILILIATYKVEIRKNK